MPLGVQLPASWRLGPASGENRHSLRATPGVLVSHYSYTEQTLMTGHRVLSVGAAGVLLTLIGCSVGDLTLPGPGQSGPEQPAELKVLSGDGQQAEAGTLLDDPLTVQVLDENSQPVAHIRVQFSFLGDLSGAAVDPASIETDEAGRAEAVV